MPDEVLSEDDEETGRWSIAGNGRYNGSRGIRRDSGESDRGQLYKYKDYDAGGYAHRTGISTKAGVEKHLKKPAAKK